MDNLLAENCPAEILYPTQTIIVTSNAGLLLKKTHKNCNQCSFFKQFEKDVVDICFEVLDNSPAALRNSEMDVLNRASSVYVSRTVTAMVSHSLSPALSCLVKHKKTFYNTNKYIYAN